MRRYLEVDAAALAKAAAATPAPADDAAATPAPTDTAAAATTADTEPATTEAGADAGGLADAIDKIMSIASDISKQLESLEDNAGDIRKKLDGAGAEEPDEDGVLYEAMVAKAVENMADLLDKLADIRIEANKLAGREGGEKPEKKEAKGKEEKAE